MHRIAKPQKTTLVSWLSRHWQDMPLGMKGLFLNGLPLLVLLGSLSSLYIHEQQAAKIEGQLQQTLSTQRDIQAVHTQLVEASAAVRNFLLTGDEAFLKNLYQAQKALPIILTELGSKLSDKEQEQRLAVINPLVQRNIEDLNALASDRSNIATKELIERFNQQSATLNQLRIHIEAMNARESVLLALEQSDLKRERNRNLTLTMIAGLIGVMGSIIGVWLFSNTIVNRVRLIRDSAAHLAKGEPMALPSISQDELGQLTVELEHTSRNLAQSAADAHQARIEAEEANMAKSRFLSRTSHELRTPLNAILGFSQILESDLQEGRARENAAMIHQAAKHLLKLINEVLDIARIESGDMSLSISAFNLPELMHEASTFIMPLGKVRDIELKTEYPETLILQADRQKLLQVILNLLSNAYKYGPESAMVYLRAYTASEQVYIEVEDQGAGIPLAKRASLFTPFERLGAENTTTEGTGLGLALSKQIIDAMHGQISLDDHKSLFRITLPLTQPHANIVMESPSSVSSETPVLKTVSATQKRNILYVEDKASNRALLEAIIRRHQNFRLHFTSNVKESKQFIQDLKPDLFIIDLNLPDGSGETLVAHIKQQPETQHTPVLILSADAMPETVARLNQMGIYRYFTKPLDIAAFNMTLTELFDESN